MKEFQYTIQDPMGFHARPAGALYEKAGAELGEAEAEIFSVHQLMAEAEDFADLIAAAIAGGAEASEAVRQAGEQCAAMFSSMDDAYMRARAGDVKDVAARIRRILRGEAPERQFCTGTRAH